MNKRSEFRSRVDKILAGINPSTLEYNENIADSALQTYELIDNYAEKNGLINTAIALPLLRGFLTATDNTAIPLLKHAATNFAYYMHDLSICRMLIDLHLPLSKDEEDITLAAALCHVLLEVIPFEEEGTELFTVYHLDPRIYQVLKIITRKGEMSKEEKEQYYGTIQQNPCGLLIKLADRANLLQQLYTISLWESRNYVRETRLWFFPMCTYGKEHYPQLVGIISILMEKMRSLAEVTEILEARYQDKEEALSKEILILQEENARIRMAIAELEAEQANS